MKKYVKPELVYESFELSQQIAACTYDSNNTMNDIVDCWFTGEIPNTSMTITIFLNGNTNCTTIGEAFCEHSGTGNNFNIFNS